MIEKEDGTFGDIKEADEVLKDFYENQFEVKAIHFGTKEELEEKKSDKDRIKEVNELAKRLSEKIDKIMRKQNEQQI